MTANDSLAAVAGEVPLSSIDAIAPKTITVMFMMNITLLPMLSYYQRKCLGSAVPQCDNASFARVQLPSSKRCYNNAAVPLLLQITLVLTSAMLSETT
jgi:hypothetical protein